jgi:hypothetical protein
MGSIIDEYLSECVDDKVNMSGPGQAAVIDQTNCLDETKSLMIN